MGMLIHHTWLEQQKQEEPKPKNAEPVPAEEPKPVEEPVTEPIKRGRRKTTK